MKTHITARTKVGNKAIQKHLDEYKKLPRYLKIQQKISGITQSVIKESPFYIVELEIKNAVSDDINYRAMTVNQIIKALENYGADDKIDFDIKVVN